MADKQGDFVWYELMTTDADAAQAFYEPLVGWSFAGSGTPGMDYRLGSMNGTEVVGLMALTEDMTKGGARPAWIGYIAADDIEASLVALKDKGGQVLHGPMEIPGGEYIITGLDPQGAMFNVIGKKGA